MSEPRLIGFDHSVYTRSARIALAEKGIRYAYEERNPFEATQSDELRKYHPFGRVPVLVHNGFELYETAAILEYLNEGFAGPDLMPDSVRARARARQVISIADSYVYEPLVRMAFSHGVYRPLIGEEVDDGRLAHGLAAAPQVLDALEEIAAEGVVLSRDRALAAAGHIFSMLDYFAMLEAGQAMLAERPNLLTWFNSFASRASAIETRPNLNSVKGEIPA